MRLMLINELLKLILHLLEILIGNQSHRDLCTGLRWKHRLRSLTLIASPDAAHIERRARPEPLKIGVAFLSDSLRNREHLLEVLLLIRQPRKLGTLFGRDIDDI